jgi:hypothetical protein
MTPYYRVEPGIHDFYGIIGRAPVSDEVSFLAGHTISVQLSSPLVFEVNHPPGEAPRHFLGSEIPVVSDLLLTAIEAAGVDNFQVFPAVLHNLDTGGKWTGYRALNVLGILDAADLQSSKYDEIVPGSEGLPPLVDFEKLVINSSKTRDLLLFRLVHNPSMMFIHGNVRDHLRQHKPPEGWGITTFEVPVS